MPIYEYQCQDCEESFEVLQLSHEREGGVECPQCGSSHTERLISAFATSAGETGSGGASCRPSSGFR